MSTAVAPARLNEIAAQWLDSTKAHAWLDWQARVSLADGLDRTVPWYRSVLGFG